jgi:pyruvate dehydrogenase (quinone)
MEWDRRNFFQVAAGMGIAAASAPDAGALTSESDPNVTSQPTPSPPDDFNTADILVETLIDWGATHVFGMVGDGINAIIEALRKRQDRIRYVGVRHEEAAAFMACGFAKHTGRLGVCVGTTGPGAIHLMNGLYDAALDGAPVVALTGLTFQRCARVFGHTSSIAFQKPSAPSATASCGSIVRPRRLRSSSSQRRLRSPARKP